MKFAKRIYCIEGVHNWDNNQEEPSANSMIKQVKDLGGDNWEYHTVRSCATLQELEYRLKYEWWNSCTKGSVLYFNTHGSPGLITLVHEKDGYQQVIGLDTLKHWVNCTGCHVHFGGCATFGCDPKILNSFLEQTNASSISGYAADEINWLDQERPGLACESILFDLLGRVRFMKKRPALADDIYEIEDALNARFDDCEFKMFPVKQANYYVNKNPRPNRVPKVHKEKCKRLSRKSTNRKELGTFYRYQDAVNAAKKIDRKAIGCQSCCPI